MFKLSEEAQNDFFDIYEYTLLNFGEQQADKYTDRLERFLNLLSGMPDMGRDYTELENLTSSPP